MTFGGVDGGGGEYPDVSGTEPRFIANLIAFIIVGLWANPIESKMNVPPNRL